MTGYWVNLATKSAPNGPGVTPDVARFRFLGSFRADGVLPLRWRDRRAGMRA